MTKSAVDQRLQMFLEILERERENPPSFEYWVRIDLRMASTSDEAVSRIQRSCQKEFPGDVSVEIQVDFQPSKDRVARITITPADGKSRLITVTAPRISPPPDL